MEPQPHTGQNNGYLMLSNAVPSSMWSVLSWTAAIAIISVMVQTMRARQRHYKRSTAARAINQSVSVAFDQDWLSPPTADHRMNVWDMLNSATAMRAHELKSE